MSAIALLRAETAAAHETVDAAFARYTLDQPRPYAAFLQAHARALPASERQAALVWPALRPRLPLLIDDLKKLGEASPPVDLGEVAEGPAAWGALYVVEGSRLGGGLLAQRVGAGLPHRYLSATHQPGEWRAIRAAIDAAGQEQAADWHDALVAGALDVFARYAVAAGQERPE